jgi:ribonuclease P protein component
VLAAPNRLRRREDFTRASRGDRARAHGLVLHVTTDRPTDRQDGRPSGPSRIGIVVSRAVGNAVVRNRVRRRLRALCRERLERLGADRLLVVRALPVSAGMTSVELGRSLDTALHRLAGAARA